MNYEANMYGCNPYMSGNIQCNYPQIPDMMSGMHIGYSYVPYQKAGKLYCECEALKNGTAFPELDKPLGVYGREFCNDSK